MSDPFVTNIRLAMQGVRRAVEFVAAWFAGTTPNHAMALLVGNYGLDPKGPWRAELIAWLTCMLTFDGLWCCRGSDEFGSSSHCAHHYAWMDALLYLALYNGDQEVLDLVMQVECGVHAVESLCATADGRIVITGARCHVGPFPPAGGGDADQRVQRNTRWGWLMGRRVHMPKLLATADDWLGLYALTLIESESLVYQHSPTGGAWAAGWPKLKAQIVAATVLPLLHNPLTVERSPQGHLVRMTSCNGAMRPALWATSTADPSTEQYGCDPSWPREYKPRLGEIPTPALPEPSITVIEFGGGKPTTIAPGGAA